MVGPLSFAVCIFRQPRGAKDTVVVVKGAAPRLFAIEIIKTSVSITRDASRAASIFQSADLLRVKFVLLKGNNRSVSVRRAEWKMSV